MSTQAPSATNYDIGFLRRHTEMFPLFLEEILKKALEKLPKHATEIGEARSILQSWRMTLSHDEHGSVSMSETDHSAASYTVNGACQCEWIQDAALDGICRHRIAKQALLRIATMIHEQTVQFDEVTLEDLGLPHQEEIPPQSAQKEKPAAQDKWTMSGAPRPDSLRETTMNIHGKEHITYVKLLDLATHRGLLKLEVKFLEVTETYALAEARLTFEDGRIFQECADATPDNVAERVKPHWRRMALTRAKCRAMRDAMNIGLATLEELEG